ncbi:MAG: sugar ABC transporter permease [Ruminiclostridium sp.]|nr:sugar ABC transporter permease [Ruminiclostridium sp.]
MFAGFLYEIKKNRFMYMLVLPGILSFLIFSYIPMGGIIIAFKDYNIVRGIFGSPWAGQAGLEHFIDFFSSYDSFKIIRNTVLLNIYSLVFGFPIPIIFALALNEIHGRYYKRAIQTVSYLPYFVSTVIIVGIVMTVLSPERGLINILIHNLGMEKVYFLIEPVYFRSIYVVTNIWRSFGWGAVIYIAAIAGVPPELYESAIVDGATKMQRIFYITIPCIRNTIIITLILSLGSIMSSNFEMVYLLYNPLTYDVADNIATYTYRRGMGIRSGAVGGGMPEYSFGAAVGMFNSTVNLLFIIASNWLSRRFIGNSIY